MSGDTYNLSALFFLLWFRLQTVVGKDLVCFSVLLSKHTLVVYACGREQEMDPFPHLWPGHESYLVQQLEGQNACSVHPYVF